MYHTVTDMLDLPPETTSSPPHIHSTVNMSRWHLFSIDREKIRFIFTRATINAASNDLRYFQQDGGIGDEPATHTQQKTVNRRNMNRRRERPNHNPT